MSTQTTRSWRWSAAAASLLLTACSPESADRVAVPVPAPSVAAEVPPDAVAVTTAQETDVATTSPPVTVTTTDAPTTTTSTAPPLTTVATTTAPTTTAPIMFYREGDEGPEIEIMQLKLITLDYLDEGLATGVFGPATARALRNFQGQYGLGVDGVFGPLTDRALTAAANSVNVDG